MPCQNWGSLSIIDRITVGQPTPKSRRYPTWQEAWGPHGPPLHAWLCHEGSQLPISCLFYEDHPAEEEVFIRDSFSAVLIAEGGPNFVLLCFFDGQKHFQLSDRKLNWQVVPIPNGDFAQINNLAFFLPLALDRIIRHFSCEWRLLINYHGASGRHFLANYWFQFNLVEMFPTFLGDPPEMVTFPPICL